MKHYEVEIATSKAGAYYAKVRYHNEELQRVVQHYLCSRINPEAEGERWAEAIYDTNIDLFFVYGLGVGYHIQALVQRLTSKQQLYILETNLEVQQQLDELMPIAQFTDSRIHLCCTEHLQEAAEFFQHYLKVIEGKSFVIESYLPSLQMMPVTIQPLKDLLQDYRLTKYSIGKFKEQVSHNISLHKEENYPNIAQLFGKFKDKPLIIVSGGPSLDQNIEALKSLDNNVFVFSTGRSVKALLQKGIRVDMFCIIDAQDEQTYLQIEGIEDETIPFVFLNTASFDTVSKYKGPKYIAYNKDSEEGQEGKIDSGGSVATAMLDLAIKFGANPIIFVGQDLAYTNGMTHSKDARSGYIDELPNMLKVKGIKGDYLATTPVLLSYKKWIERKIRKYPHISFINATEGGAFIKGCEHKTLKEVLREV